MSSPGCPSEAELAAFSQGVVAGDAFERLASHVTDCPACRDRLATLDDHSSHDDLVQAIRKTTQVFNIGPAPADAPRAGSDAAFDSSTRPTDETIAEPRDAEGPGSRIGPYRLQQLLGEGGFGSVFLAEQTEPVRRQVALKLVKLGMDTRQVLARFQAERQALALMDHPNIARVLDAGTSDRGRPYFVMELARGVAITDYCDSQKLSARRRLELLIQVCEAVQHAHARGVIHRDLKPANVLITMRDGNPVPKVIDFGIAKAIGGRLTDQTLYTEMRHFIGTPEYMSPEQAEGGALEIDGRTDVYSLGVLMYELLAGSTPMDARTLRAKGIGEIGRTLRESDPPKPSTRVGALPADSATVVATARATEPRRLSRTLRGDLDWVVMKCLEKDRTLRYANPGELAADVRRYLVEEPVYAGPPGVGYRLRKLARRNRAALLTSAGLAAAVLVGAGVTLYLRNAPPTPVANTTQPTVDTGDAARADAILTATPDQAMKLLDQVRALPDGGKAVAVSLQSRHASGTPGSRDRLRAACALALLAERVSPMELVDAIPTAASGEGRLLIGGLAAIGTRGTAEMIGERLRQMAGPESAASTETPSERQPSVAPLKRRARAAITLLFLAQPGAFDAFAAPNPDGAPSAALVAEFAGWHGDAAVLPTLLDWLTPAGQATLCLGIGRLDPATLAPAARAEITKKLLALHASAPSAAVHAASEFALTRWGEKPAAFTSAPPAGNREWFVDKSGLTLCRVPAGFAVLGDERDGAKAVPTLFVRPFHMSSDEIPAALFQQFVDDPNTPPEERPRTWNVMRSRPEAKNTPAAFGVSLVDAARFCNWLSAREGLTPYYDLAGPPALWRFDSDADGYRLPTSAEWEYAARAGTTTRYPSGDDEEHLPDVARTARGDLPVQPNRWGLFNTLGGVWELCWDDNLAAAGGAPHHDNATAGPAIDPKPAGAGRFAVARGGAIGSGANELRMAVQAPLPQDAARVMLGFRVVRPVVPADQSAEIIPPEDLGTLWVKANELRPGSAAIAGRTAEHHAAHAQVDGRFRRLREAEERFRKAATLKKDDLTLWWYTGTLAIGNRNDAGHREAVEQMRRILSANETPGGCDRLAKVMLYGPTPPTGPDLAAAAGYGRRALELVDTSPSHRPWFELIAGVADYREGKFADAVRRLEEARSTATGPGGQIEADFFLAMALHAAGRKDDARAAFDRGSQLLQERVPAEADDWQVQWTEGLMGMILKPQAAAAMNK